MKVVVGDSKERMGLAAAEEGANLIRAALAANGQAFVILATGASQFEMLQALVRAPDIDWSRVTGFHLDEYIGMPLSHPASFRGYLKERFVGKICPGIREFHYINGEVDPQAECDRVGAIISRATIDVAFIGVGENGHVAFNDPPADFETTEPYIVVNLDEACRRQQLGEGWFPTLDDVPTQAISMSVREIMRAHSIVCTVPDERKREAVAKTLEGPVTADAPASILQQHADCRMFLDKDSAAGLEKEY